MGNYEFYNQLIRISCNSSEAKT